MDEIEIENENVRALVEFAMNNDEFHAKTQVLEKRLKEIVDEYIEFARENGVVMEESDFSSRNLSAMNELIEIEDADPEVQMKAAELEAKMQQVVQDYIATAEEYGLTLTAEDFNAEK